ncbi:MAG: O-antigen ligase family protein [Lachnospiraceae bacterium]|nr:O-antigen ligase family protein [Lachnospiraceae bacterium]
MELNVIKEKSGGLTAIILMMVVIFSVFSQVVAVEKIARPSMYALWVIALIYGTIRNDGKVRLGSFSKIFLVGYGMFWIYCTIVGMFNGKHFEANYIRALVKPLIVTIVGEMYYNTSRSLINQIGRIYLICAVVFAIWVQVTFLPSYSTWLTTRIYLFGEKNSAGQIWISAILIALVLIDYKNILDRLLSYIACLYLLIMTGICQCRTSLLGFVICFVCYGVYKSKNKIKWILCICVIGVLVWFIPFTHQFIEQALFLNKYAGADLNTFSSGRINLIIKALHRFSAIPIIGLGKYYVDCSYVLILAETGIIGFLIIEWIWFNKLKQCVFYKGEKKEQAFLFIIAIFYVVESMLEGYPPFGPGVSSFMFWLVSGLLINRKKDSQEGKI